MLGLELSSTIANLSIKIQFYRVYTSTLLIFMVKLRISFWFFPQVDVYSLFIERAKPCAVLFGLVNYMSFSFPSKLYLIFCSMDTEYYFTA